MVRRLTVVLLVVLGIIACASSSYAAESRRPIQITYLGNAGWQISDGKAVILVDPYISEFRTRKSEELSAADPTISPWTKGIDEHIHKADYILITHGHEDHHAGCAVYLEKDRRDHHLQRQRSEYRARLWHW